jgi:hypothetical protein
MPQGSRKWVFKPRLYQCVEMRKPGRVSRVFVLDNHGRLVVPRHIARRGFICDIRPQWCQASLCTITSAYATHIVILCSGEGIQSQPQFLVRTRQQFVHRGYGVALSHTSINGR